MAQLKSRPNGVVGPREICSEDASFKKQNMLLKEKMKYH